MIAPLIPRPMAGAADWRRTVLAGAAGLAAVAIAAPHLQVETPVLRLVPRQRFCRSSRWAPRFGAIADVAEALAAWFTIGPALLKGMRP